MAVALVCSKRKTKRDCYIPMQADLVTQQNACKKLQAERKVKDASFRCFCTLLQSYESDMALPCRKRTKSIANSSKRWRVE